MKARKGFTLIELLVVIAIIAILAAILFPIFVKMKDKAKQSTCQSNMKQIGTALKSYITNYDDTLPTNKRTRPYANGVRVEDASIYSNTREQVVLPVINEMGAIVRNNFPSWIASLAKYSDITSPKGQKSLFVCPVSSQTPGNEPSEEQVPNYVSSNERVDTTKTGPDKEYWTFASYAFNGLVAELPESSISRQDNLMIARELATQTIFSVLRPRYDPVDLLPPSQGGSPDDSFLDPGMEGGMHFKGSHILFADGHVRYFKFRDMSDGNNVVWDPETYRYYNVGTVMIDGKEIKPSNNPNAIAVTP